MKLTSQNLKIKFKMLFLNNLKFKLFLKFSICKDISYYPINENGYYNENNLNLFYCVFFRITSYNNYGSVIFINGIETKLNLNNCMFFSCSTSSSYGGCIYYGSSYTNSGIFLKMICCFECKSSTQGHFAYIDSNKDHFLYYSSISKSPNDIGIGYSMIKYYGNQTSISCNFSKNIGNQATGLYSGNPSNFLCLYLTIFDNYCSHGLPIYFSNGKNQNLMNFCNIIQNFAQNYGVVYLDGGGIYYISNCIFSNNLNLLFYIHEGSINLKNNLISQTNSNYGTFINLGNNTFTNNNFEGYLLNHFNTYFCKAIYPINLPYFTYNIKNKKFKILFLIKMIID